MLSIKNLSKTYPGGVAALREVNLDMPAGMFGLLGPNGAGKSSLMRTIATLQEADTGSVVFAGIDVLKNKTAIRQTLGYLPQDFGVYPKVSALDLLDHFAVLKGYGQRGERKAAVEALLQQVNLWEHRKKAVSTYSGGMRQRFGIAQALLGDPRLVIVDEPTAGLDPEERNRFLNLLASIGEDKLVILSTHIVEDVTDLCPRMAIMAQGQVVLTGEPNEAIAELHNKVWKRSVARQDVLEYKQRMVVLSERFVAGKPTLHVYADTAPGDGFVQVAPDLEDVYFLKQRHAKQSNIEQSSANAVAA
jgi:ABC-type multidrug transport system ATPase subunit